MFRKIYSGEFVSQRGIAWRCDILRDQDEAPEEVGELTFPADEPLVLSWEDTDKYEPICSSTATLQIESPGDRTYVGLYSIQPGSVRLDVYREGLLYWSGTLDPEFYEEPYERLDHYDVSLTFSDFGILDRLKYDLTGRQTIEALVKYILSRARINYQAIDYTTYSSTMLDDGTSPATIHFLGIASDNFYDEDEEPSKLEDVLKDILQPLALRIIQRSGKIWVYDLNGLYKNGERKEIVWAGDSQTLGTDKVYNNVRITFSPYASSDIISDEIKYKDKATGEQTNANHDERKVQDASTGHEYYSFYPNYSDSNVKDDPQNISFTLHLSTKGVGVKHLRGLKFYKMVSQLGGSESQGLCVSAVLGHRFSAANSTGNGIRIGLEPTARDVNTALLTTRRAYLPPLSADDAKRYYIRLCVEALIDPRYNPFTSSTDEKYNEGDARAAMEEDFSFVFIPACVTLYDDSGNAVAYYDNYDAAVNTHNEVHFLPTLGSWKNGGETAGRCWLEYYDKESNRRHKTGILGWQTNRQTIGASREDLKESFQNMEDGQYIPYPAQGGYLEVKICEGLWPYWDLGWTVETYPDEDYILKLLNGKTTTYAPLPLGETYDESMARDEPHMKWLDRIRWYLLKAPEVNIVGAYAGNEEIKSDDIEYTGYVNKQAKEDLSIDTTCGTADGTLPTARGILLDASTGRQIAKLSRNGVTDHPEKLLIGTVCSQYADRHVTLTGLAQSPQDGLSVYKEQNQGDRIFLLTQEEYDVISDCSDLTITELSADEYEGIEEVDDD